MTRKERLLGHITSNIDYFMETTAAVKVIPYTEITDAVLARAQQYIASLTIDRDEVVCLISTSISEYGKSGILFTTDAVYCRAWGIFTSKYWSLYYTADIAEFGIYNEFNPDRMREIMRGLDYINSDENEIEQKREQRLEKIVDTGLKLGKAVLKGMALVEEISLMSDSEVAQNNEKIANELEKLPVVGGENNNQEKADEISIYEEFVPLINHFDSICEINEDELDEDTFKEIVSTIRDILEKLYKQTLDNIGVTPDKEERYREYENWLDFWSLMFYDSTQFKEKYPIEVLEDAPESWRRIIGMMDDMLEEKWEDSFSNLVDMFAETILDNREEINDFMSGTDWDEELLEEINEKIQINNDAVKIFSDELGKAVNFLEKILENI